MKTNYDFIHLPAGATVYAGESVEDLVDLGVIPDDTETTLNITYDSANVQGSKGELVLQKISNMSAELTTELYQINLANINLLAGGVMTLTRETGAKVTGSVFEVASFEKGKFIPLPGQNADGTAQDITGINNGETPLTEGTDFFQAKVGSAWGIVITSDSTALPASGLEVTYDYTPARHVKATMGSGSVELKPCIVRVEKEVDGKLFRVTLYKAFKTDGIALSFPAVNSDDITSLPVTMQGMLDTSRANGDQLLEIIDEIGANA